EKIAVLTSYDASFTRVLENAGVEVLLVGDSLGMVVQGHDTTLPVTLEEIIYHLSAVSRGRQRALLIADMPFMTDPSPEAALANAGRLIKEGGAHMVKLEGGAHQVETVRTLTRHSVAVCAHLGLLPQNVHRMGGYVVQGRDEHEAQHLIREAVALQNAGAQLLVLECVPARLAEEITGALEIPVIGIGAGAATDGQVLVLYDIIGISAGPRPRFAHDFLEQAESIEGAVAAYVRAVKDGTYPAAQHGFS
ncbi:MAG: 3-methyl-2-oxobutanoate hydroxymethyltransferase, partial [Pseudomonadota bacterium]